MPSVIEEAGVLVETALTFAPWLVDVPVLGRILVFLAPHGGNEAKALEQLQKQAQDRQARTKTRIEKNARYVLKASDAMTCVNNALNNGGLLLALGRGLLNQVAGRPDVAPDLLEDAIFACIEEHTLRQDSIRSKREKKTKFLRPAKGHGHGRIKGKRLRPQQQPPPQPSKEPPRA